MAVQTPPYVLQNASHSAELARRELQAGLPIGSAGGVVPATPVSGGTFSDLQVTAPTSGMSVNVAAGQIFVPGSLGSGAGFGMPVGYAYPQITLNGASAPTASSKATVKQLTTQGCYYCYNDNSTGAVNLLVAAANASNPRIDLVVAQVEDSQYSGSNNDWKLAVVTGTPAASPTLPTIPANALPIAAVWVPAAASNIVAADILDLRVSATRNPYRAYMYRAATGSTVTGSNAFAMDTVAFDPTGSITIASSTFTAPVAGMYGARMRLGISATAAGNRIFCQVFKNGAEVLRGVDGAAYTGSTFVGSVAAGDIPLNAGDTLQPYLFSSASGLTVDVGIALAFFDVTLLSPL